MSMRTLTLSVFLGLSLALTACGSSPTPTPAATAPVATVPAAATVAATNTPVPPTTVPATATTVTTPVAASNTAGAASSPSTSAAATAALAGTSASGPAISATGTITAASAGATGSPAAGTTIFTIVSDHSEASYTVNEKLVNLPTPRDAVGKTSAITGQIALAADGKPTDASKITVDLTTLKSDQSKRDDYIRTTSLESNMYPMAVFTITGVDGLSGPLPNGTPTAFKLLGNLTIHGVTKPVAFDTNATMQGDTLNGTATLTFKMGDFNITPPMVTVLTTSDVVKLDLKISAKKAA